MPETRSGPLTDLTRPDVRLRLGVEVSGGIYQQSLEVLEVRGVNLEALMGRMDEQTFWDSYMGPMLDVIERDFRTD